MRSRVKAHNGKGRTKGGTLRNAQGGGGGQGIAQDVLHNAARQGQCRPYHHTGDDAGHTDIPDNGGCLFGAAAYQCRQNFPHGQTGGANGDGNHHAHRQNHHQGKKHQPFF